MTMSATGVSATEVEPETTAIGTAEPAASDESDLTELELERRRFRTELLDAGLLLDAGSPGLYGRSGLFEDILDAFDRAYVEALSSYGATRFRFPPIYARDDFEKTDYIASFPNLTGSVNTFAGGDREHAELLKARADGLPWDDWLSPTDSMLASAVCHPLYGRLEGQRMAPGGSTFEVAGYCFRHEPSLDPMRLQAFRQHDFVYVGDAQGARDFRENAFQILLELLLSLGLQARGVAANDPFFGRAGRILAHNQLSEELKLEIVVPIYPSLEEGTAIGSGNRHEDHFGAPFGIEAADGSVAHSACIGAGLERTTLALLRTHGLDPRDWPASVTEKLGLG